MSALIFGNQTPYIAQFIAKRGQLIMARLPGVEPGAELQVPSDDVYTMVATTIIEGNTYSTAPVTVTVNRRRHRNATGTHRSPACRPYAETRRCRSG